jgi:amino acid transporter/mannitol/fructose-specific phosphotransferase system IIA component (Ntr-type)
MELIAMKLKKELGFIEVFCISSGAMISSGLFILPALAYAKTGASVIIAYAIASLLIIPTVLSKAELTTAMPKTGGIYFFTDRSMGPMMGTIGGLAAWFSLAFKTAFALLGIGIFLVLFNPGFTILQIKLVAIACVLLFMAINLYGVKFSGKFQVIIVLTLISILILYIFVGAFFIEFSRYTPLAPLGLGSIFATAGLVFISFAGTTKIAAIAGEVKNPKRNLPLGMFFSWGIVSLLYIFVIFVTVGVVDPIDLENSLTPLSLGGEVTMGLFGILIMSFAGLLAFISTGNAGILAASRDPMAMGKDELIPGAFSKISKRGTPWVSIVFTSGFMIAIILFLDLEDFVKTASTLKLILFILANLALIFMRESNIRHYRPKYKAPFYPWIQVVGIVGYGFLIIQMGSLPLMIAGIFIACALGWYFIYAHGKIKREYALLHVVERVTGIKSTDHLIDEELREILIERDNITEKRFARLIKRGVILDLNKKSSPDILTKQIAHILKEHLNVDEKKIFKLLLKREKKDSIMIKPGVIVPSIIIPGHKKSDFILIRSKKGITFSNNYPPANAVFIIVSTRDEYHFYLHALMWLTQIIEEPDFQKKWLKAKNSEELRQIILSSWEKEGPKV